ncbi:hypothetical protein N9H56_03805 [Pseudomonadales bacterium]|nr:hypothetical protein [Pseudomonadales bacterium]
MAATQILILIAAILLSLTVSGTENSIADQKSRLLSQIAKSDDPEIIKRLLEIYNSIEQQTNDSADLENDRSCQTERRFDDCTGTKEFSNGTTAYGYWQNDKLEGQAIYTWANGSRFSGTFSAGETEGFGIMTWPNDRTFSGFLKPKFKYQYGLVSTKQDSYTYRCETPSSDLNDCSATKLDIESAPCSHLKEKHDCYGFGPHSDPDGYFLGFWRNGRAHSTGFFIYGNSITESDFYIGDLQDGLQQGTGKYTWRDGSSRSSYEGEFSEDYFDGTGVFSFPDGDSIDVQCKKTISVDDCTVISQHTNEPSSVPEDPNVPDLLYCEGTYSKFKWEVTGTKPTEGWVPQPLPSVNSWREEKPEYYYINLNREWIRRADGSERKIQDLRIGDAEISGRFKGPLFGKASFKLDRLNGQLSVRWGGDGFVGNCRKQDLKNRKF